MNYCRGPVPLFFCVLWGNLFVSVLAHGSHESNLERRLHVIRRLNTKELGTSQNPLNH